MKSRAGDYSVADLAWIQSRTPAFRSDYGEDRLKQHEIARLRSLVGGLT